MKKTILISSAKTKVKVSNLLIPMCFILFYLEGNAQNNLSMVQIRKDKIAIYNPNSHAIAVKMANQDAFIIPSYSGKSINFSLSTNNVKNVVFNSFYNSECYKQDILACEYKERGNIDAANPIGRNLWFNTAIDLLLQGTNAGKVKDLILMISGNDPDVFKEIIAAYESNDPNEQKRLRLNQILKDYNDKIEIIKKQKGICVDEAKNQLDNNKTIRSFHASQLIRKQENFRFEISPYYLIGYNAIIYKNQTNERSAFNEMNNNMQIPFGIRASLNFNAYNAYKQRKLDKKIYLTFDYSQSPIIYKVIPDNIFKKDTGYAWNFYSAGIGWETLGKNIHGNYNSSLAFDIGLVTSSNIKYGIDGNKNLMSKQITGSFKEVNIYGNIIFKQKMFSFLDVFASYKLSANLFGSDANKAIRELPSYRQFQFGLNFILARTVNYQY